VAIQGIPSSGHYHLLTLDVAEWLASCSSFFTPEKTASYFVLTNGLTCTLKKMKSLGPAKNQTPIPWLASL
jgi:hypothetical protein